MLQVNCVVVVFFLKILNSASKWAIHFFVKICNCTGVQIGVKRFYV